MKNYRILPKDIIRREVDGQHHYFVGDRHYVSVTHILDVAGPKEFGLMNFLKQNTPDDIERIKSTTGDFGTICHDGFEKLLYGVNLETKNYTDPQKKIFMQFQDWFKTARPTQYLPEQVIVWDDGLNLMPEGTQSADQLIGNSDRFGGTLDFLGEITVENLLRVENCFSTKAAMAEFQAKYPDPQQKLLCLIDFKTTSGIYFSHKLQVGAYKLAAEQMFGRKVDVCAIARFGTKHKSGYEFKMFDGDWAATTFQSVFNTFKQLNGGKLPEPPTIEVYPETIQLVDVDMREAE